MNPETDPSASLHPLTTSKGNTIMKNQPLKALSLTVLTLLTVALSACGTGLTEAPTIPDTELSSQAVLPNVSGFVTYIHFNGLTGKNQIVKVNQQTDQKTVLFETNYNDSPTSVASSKDGNTLVYSYRNDIYRRVGSTTTNLTNNPAQKNYNVSLSADGKRVAWERNEGSKRVITVRTYTSNGFSQLTLPASVSQYSPSISGNGKYIALTRTVNNQNQVLRYTLSSNSYTTIHTTSNSVWSPSPSDSNKVAWTEQAGQNYQLRSKVIGSSAKTHLTTTQYIDHSHMTADGKYMTYNSYENVDGGKYMIVTRNLSSGQTAKVAYDSHNFRQAFWQK